MTTPTIDDLIAQYRFERDLRSDEYLISSLWIDAETSAAFKARKCTLPQIALAKIAETTGAHLLAVLAISNLALAELSEPKRQFWLDRLN